MGGLHNDTDWSSVFNTSAWQEETVSDRATPPENRRPTSEKVAYLPTNNPINIQPASALNGQPYPTLPFSLGGYGLEENTNQLIISRQIGKDMLRQRRPSSSRHKSLSSSRSHKRRIPMPHSSSNLRESSGRRNDYRIQSQAPSTTPARCPPKAFSLPEKVWNQRNAMIWQRDATPNRRHSNASLGFLAQNHWQHQPFIPHAAQESQYLYPPQQHVHREDPRSHHPSVGLGIQSHHPDRLAWNEEQWMRNQMISTRAYMGSGAEEDGKSHAAYLGRW